MRSLCRLTTGKLGLQPGHVFRKCMATSADSNLLDTEFMSVASMNAPVNEPSSRTAERTELRGALVEMEHLRGGLGGIAPMHVNIDSRVLHGFRWVETGQLKAHEEVRPVAASALQAYLDENTGGDGVPPSIPAIVACSRTKTIIDGHHRHKVITSMGFPLVPVLYIDYGHHDVIVHIDESNPMTKQDVIDAAIFGKVMKPKSTAHVIRAGNGSLHPVVSLSPNCSMMETTDNLTGGWSYKVAMQRRHSRIPAHRRPTLPGDPQADAA